MVTGSNETPAIFHDKLMQRIYKEDVFIDQDIHTSILAFKLDEDELTKYEKEQPRKMSIREYIGMDNKWHACDYVLFDTGASNQPVMFIVEKTDVIVSAIEIKENSKKYQNLMSSINDGIKQSCKCPDDVQDATVDIILNNFIGKIIVDELVDENKNKLYSSLHILCRLQSDLEFRDCFMPNMEYRFILLALPNKAARDKCNFDAVYLSLKGKLEERLERISALLKSDIQNKQHSAANPSKALQIRFGGIQETPKSFTGYLKAKSNTEYIKIDKLPS